MNENGETLRSPSLVSYVIANEEYLRTYTSMYILLLVMETKPVHLHPRVRLEAQASAGSKARSNFFLYPSPQGKLIGDRLDP